MNFEFMTIDTPLPPCMPFPRALTGFPVSSTAKVMYCRMLDAMLSKGQEDENGILFVCFPVTAIAAVLSRSPMTVKRSLNELETAGLTMNTILNGAKLPKIEALKKSRRELAGQKKELYAEYRDAQRQMREAVAIKANIDHLLGITDERENKAQER